MNGLDALVDPDVVEVDDLVVLDGRECVVEWAERHGDWVTIYATGHGHEVFHVRRDQVRRRTPDRVAG